MYNTVLAVVGAAVAISYLTLSYPKVSLNQVSNLRFHGSQVNY